MRAQIDAIKNALKDYTQELTDAKRSPASTPEQLTYLISQIDALAKALELLRAIRDRDELTAKIALLKDA